MEEKSMKFPPVTWNPKCSLIDCHTDSIEVESLIIWRRLIIGQKFEIWLSINSRCMHLVVAVIWLSPTGSSRKPRLSVGMRDFLFHLTALVSRGAKRESSWSVNSRLFFHDSKLLGVSVSLRTHCLGAAKRFCAYVAMLLAAGAYHLWHMVGGAGVVELAWTVDRITKVCL